MNFLKIVEGDNANFWCPSRLKCENCEYCDKVGALNLNFKENLSCPNTDEKLKLVGRSVINNVTGNLSVDAIQAERKIRSRKDFDKNILPTFKQGSDEAIHFKKRKMLEKK